MQDALPTVGDTIWAVRTVRAPAGAVVRAPDWAPDGVVERLGTARVRQVNGEVEVAWPLVAWEPGRHRLEVPGPRLVWADGREEALPPQLLEVAVASVLPRGRDGRLAPQPAAGYVARPVTSPVPVLVAAGIALLLVGLAWWWRRRPRAPLPVPPSPAPPRLPIAAWRAAGEVRWLLEASAARLAVRAGEPEVAAWLAAQAEARFAGAEPAVLARLADEGARLAGLDA